MPFISTKVNVKLSEEREKIIKGKLGKAIELLPGKTEKWLMLNFEDQCHLYFGGKDENPMAYIEVKIFGSASEDAYSRLTKEITKIYSEELGINPSFIYVKYEETAHWGWNGTNF